MISVVITVYNKAHTIERTLNSVLNQNYTDFEVIIVDDGSTDDSISIINIFLKDSRIKLIRQKNQGVSIARNRGVKESLFEYIAFLDGDDEWFPDYLLKMHEAINLFPKAGMYCCAGVYKETPEVILDYRVARKYKNKILPINYFENPHVFSHTSATIVLKTYFNKVGGFMKNMGINEDFALFYELALISKVIYIGFPLSCYYGNIKGQITSINKNEHYNLRCITNRINHSFNVWTRTNYNNQVFPIFLKYEIRHIFITYLRIKNYKNIQLIFDNLDPQIKRMFCNYELFMITNEKLTYLSIIYILITKIKRRLSQSFLLIFTNK